MFEVYAVSIIIAFGQSHIMRLYTFATYTNLLDSGLRYMLHILRFRRCLSDRLLASGDNLLLRRRIRIIIQLGCPRLEIST